MGRPRTYQVNEDAFDPLKATSMEYAYWLGFLLADGCVYGKYLSVTLAAKDKEVLEKLRDFLGSTHPIRTRKEGSVRLEIHSEKLTAALKSWHIVERKSLVATVPDSLKNSPDFWRGMIDGDGYVATKQRERTQRGKTHTVIEHVISLVGTREICSAFEVFVKNNAITTRAQVREHKFSNAFYFDVTGPYAKMLHKLLYSRPGPRLTRKEQALLVV